MEKKYRVLIFLVVTTVIGLLGARFFELGGGEGKFLITIENCNTVDSVVRFSCYRVAIEKYYKGEESLGEFTHKIKNTNLDFGLEDKSYAIFGTNCHTFYHALGDFVGTHHKGSVGDVLDIGTTECTNGYVMGLFKRTAIRYNFSSDFLQDFYKTCNPDTEIACAHEIGHLLHDKHTESILKTLDEISNNQFKYKYPEQYTYRLFEEPNLEAPFKECRELLPEEKQSLCYTGVGHNLFLFSKFSSNSPIEYLKECDTALGSDDYNKCHEFLLFRIGINLGAPEFLSDKFFEGREVCEKAASISIEDAKNHCYRGIGGGIGLFFESQYVSEHIAEEDIPVIRSSVEEYARMCEASEGGFEEECFYGLLGTKYLEFYKKFDVFHENIEKVLPNIDEGQPVVG